MRIVRTEHGWSVEVPADVVAALGLRDGEEVEIDIRPVGTSASAATADAVLSRLQARPPIFPAGFEFDREEANARR